MAFGALSSAHQILVLLALKGGPEYAAQMERAAAETGGLGKAVLTTSAAMEKATKRSWLHNQALFTARRYAFYATLAVSGLAYEVFRLGMSYQNTVQTARVALKGMFPTKQALDTTINQLYKLSTLSPFLFKDTLTAFRTMAPAMKNAGIGPTQTIRTMHAVMDALAQSGRSTTGNLTRVGVQLQHLANIGRPTGQVLLALARDGLPVYPAMRKELGLTGTALENMASSGYTAAQVIEALNKFIETSPIYRGQAFKQATQTLQGNWQMFKDILSQAAGSAEGGLFAGLTNRMKAINQYLAPLLRANKPIGLIDIAKAINSAFTPRSNVILNVFVVFTQTLKTILFLLNMVGTLLSNTIGMIGKLGQTIGVNNIVAKTFGTILGTIVTLFIIGKAVLFPFILMFDLWKSVVKAAEIVAVIYRATMFAINGEWRMAWALITANTAATEVNTGANAANAVSMADRTAIMGSFDMVLAETTIETEAAAGSMVLFGLSLDAMLGPIGLVLAGLTLLILYHKQIENWRPVKGIQSFIEHPGRGLHNIRKHPGHAAHSFLDYLDFASNPAGYVGRKLLGFQHGGYMGMGGWAMVGEGGPEMVHLPAASSVHPLNNSSLSSGALTINVYPQDIYLDGKKVGTVLATAVTDKEARMGGRNT